MKLVDEANQDDMGRVLGYYVYGDTKIWFEDGKVHRADGPAVISPDGVERWYLRGKEITIDARSFFSANKWSVKKGLDTPEKLAAFQAAFCK
ncbi:aldehyde dehydrogenase [Methylocapsa polymorpha]|uniref:Aldehyde dehydrogenase n=1 Tax=Methylocapsa polymorpha TaxID=3080828 RepID=A0ABZ0HVX3_9HYPH|nr:aldehyde dehydrogenase [Methylocapsa sp. RX1]